jgi:hypothetical protein
MSVDVFVERPVSGRRTGLELAELLTTLDGVRRTQPAWCDLKLDEMLVVTDDVTVQFESWAEGMAYLRSLTNHHPNLVHFAWTPNTCYARSGVARIICRLNSNGRVWVGHSDDQAAAVGMAELLSSAIERSGPTAPPSLSRAELSPPEKTAQTTGGLHHPVIAYLILPVIAALVAGVVLKVLFG